MALYFTSIVVEQLKTIHPFIEYWFLVNILSNNNLENFVFTRNIITSLGGEAIEILKTTPSIYELIRNEKVLKTVFDFHKIVNPVYTDPKRRVIQWPEIKVLKKDKNFNILINKEETTNESGDPKSS